MINQSRYFRIQQFINEIQLNEISLKNMKNFLETTSLRDNKIFLR